MCSRAANRFPNIDEDHYPACIYCGCEDVELDGDLVVGEMRCNGCGEVFDWDNTEDLRYG